MNLRDEFKRALVRRIAFVLVAVVLAWLGIGKVSAAGFEGCPSKDNYTRHQCNHGEAYAWAASVGACPANVGGNPTTGSRRVSETSNNSVSVECEITYWNGQKGFAVLEWTYYADCPVDKPWNETLKVCGNDCENRAPLGSGWVEGDWQNDTSMPTQVCDGGCAFDQPIGGTRDVACVDGQCWTDVSGFTPSGQMCTAGTGYGSLGDPPPPDSDGDGVSNGNDGSPNNPGSTGGGAGAKPEDSSNACGGPGQPACPADGSGKGSGNGNTSGGGQNCSTPPSSSGDAILANLTYQAWATRCAIEKATNKDGSLKVAGKDGSAITVVGGAGNGEGEGEGSGQLGGCTPQGSVQGFACAGDPVGCIQAEAAAIQRCREQAKDSDNNGMPDWMQGDEPDIPGDGDGDYEETAFGINVSTDLLDTENIFGSGSCPVFTLNSGLIQFNSADIPAWCTLVAIMRAVVLLVGAYAAIRILLGSN